MEMKMKSKKVWNGEELSPSLCAIGVKNGSSVRLAASFATVFASTASLLLRFYFLLSLGLS